MSQQCEQLEADANRGNSRGLFQTVRNSGRFQPRLLTIKDKQRIIRTGFNGEQMEGILHRIIL